MRLLRGVYLIARREYLAYVGAWGFWVSLITTPLLLAVMIFTPALLSRAEPTRQIAIIADDAGAGAAVRAAFEAQERERLRAALAAHAETVDPKSAPAALAAFDARADLDAARRAALAALELGGPPFQAPVARYRITPAPARDAEALAPYLTGAKEVEGAPLFAVLRVIGSGEATRLEYWSANLTDQAPAARARTALADRMRTQALAARGLSAPEVARIEGLAPAFVQYDPRTPAGREVTRRDSAPFFAAIALTFVLWGSVFGVSNMLLTSVLEEKSNKILDALLTSVTPLQILIGKLLGVACVSATLFLIWGVLGAGGLAQTAALAPSGQFADFAGALLMPSLAAAFALCFAAGYLMYGAMFLALGALCDSIQEAQTLVGPVFFVLTIPILLIGPAFENPNAPIVAAASWFPPATPFLLMLRAPAGLTPGEIAGPILALVITLALVLMFAARLFRAGVSHQLKAADVRQRLGSAGRKRPHPAPSHGA